eukprot:3608477-Pyramimonas_sp.AAC.1
MPHPTAATRYTFLVNRAVHNVRGGACNMYAAAPHLAPAGRAAAVALRGVQRAGGGLVHGGHKQAGGGGERRRQWGRSGNNGG